ncbi:MAG: type II toxin-antitoxin system HicB family antitoxin [Firmicutes bacterium]|nr:type II toxin-antitoxin system HicB family antitoxin [Bacillota bacterium]
MEKQKYFYPARFKWEDDKVLVSFIDFDCAFTDGNDFEDAYYMAQDVLYNILPEYKNNLPKPTLNYMNLEFCENEIISVVELDIKEHEKKISKKIVNTTVTMPQWLKEKAESKGINFSKALQEKLKQELDI